MFTNTDSSLLKFFSKPFDITLEVSGETERRKFELFFEKVMRNYSPNDKSRNIIALGWIEPILVSDSQDVEEITSQLSTFDQVAVIK
jgi:hypothetical protein